MSKQNDPVKKKPTIKIVVSSTEYDTLKMEAEKRGLSIQEYGHRRLFDDVNGVEDRCSQIMRLMPGFYNRVHEVSEHELKKWFAGFGGELCQLLK